MQRVRTCVVATGLLASVWLVAAAQPMPPDPQENAAPLPPLDPAGNTPPAGADPGAVAKIPKDLLPARVPAETRPAGDQRANILAALDWLAAHQAEDGAWDPLGFPEAGAAHGRTADAYGNPDGKADTGWAHLKVGVTGMAVLAFLTGGYTHETAPIDGSQRDFGAVVRKALIWLRAQQDDDGCIDTCKREESHFVYNHAIATQAILEAYAMTGSGALLEPAKRAVAFIIAAQNNDKDRGLLGWRYGVQPGDSDTNVTTWMSLPLVLARQLNLELSDDVLGGTYLHLADMTGRFDDHCVTGYIQRSGHGMHRRDEPPLPANTACNLLLRKLVGPLATTGGKRTQRRKLDEFRKLVKALSEEIGDFIALPVTNDPEQLDYHYWYVGSLAAFQAGGVKWNQWRNAVMPALISTQRMQGDATNRVHGSWDSASVWGVAGSRVYATAMNCLTLQTTLRYRQAKD